MSNTPTPNGGTPDNRTIGQMTQRAANEKMSPEEQAAEKRSLEIADKLPAEIQQMILASFAKQDFSRRTSVDINDPDIAVVMPSREVVNAVLYAYGVNDNAPSVSDLDQAEMWMKEQAEWQDFAAKINARLQRDYPLDRKAALKGEFPLWMFEGWATILLLEWSDGLKDAVMAAQEYLDSVTPSATMEDDAEELAQYFKTNTDKDND